MPRKKQKYQPIIEVVDGKQVINTGMIIEVRPLISQSEFAENFMQYISASEEARKEGKRIAFDPETFQIVEPDTNESVLNRMEARAIELLRPHLSESPMTAEEIRVWRSKQKGRRFDFDPTCETGDTEITAVHLPDKQWFAVTESSRPLPIIRAVVRLLNHIRWARNKSSPSFLAGITIGRLFVDMEVRNCEPNLIGRMKKFGNEYRKRVDSVAIVSSVNNELTRMKREGKQTKKTRAYVIVAEKFGYQDFRQVANIYRAAQRRKKATKKTRK